MRKTTTSTKKKVVPYVLITVNGGVADIAVNGSSVDVDILDFDNLKESTPGITLSKQEWEYLKKNDPREYARLQLPESVKEARAGLIPSEETDSLNPLNRNDQETAILDEALNTAEEVLKPLLKMYSADYVSELFKAHVRCHVSEELLNIEIHGHRNDSEEDVPPVTTYQELLSLALLVQAANTEFDGLERRANEVLARVGK
jgi:hypothetical protein